MKVHHIGYAVPSIEKAEKVFEKLGYQSISPQKIKDEGRNVNVKFMTSEARSGMESYCIELLEIADSDQKSPLDRIIKGRSSLQATPYHFCYEVEDIRKTAEILRKEKFIPLDPEPSEGMAFGRDVLFMYHKDIGIIELLEQAEYKLKPVKEYL